MWQFVRMHAECKNKGFFPGRLRALGMVELRASFGFVLLLTLVWCILQEAFTLANVAFGLVVSVATITFTNVFVLKEDFCKRYAIRPFVLLWYLLVLIWKIYDAGFHAMAKILTGGVNVNIVEVHTILDNPFHIALLANSITLTPGTVTMQTDGQRLKVIWIDAHTRDPVVAGKEIKGGFEAMLVKAAVCKAQEREA